MNTPYPFQNGLIVHVNAFNHKIAGGYLIENGKPMTKIIRGKAVRKSLTPREISEVIAANWEIPVSFTKV